MLNKRILVLMFLLVFLPLVGCFPAPTPPNETPIITSTPIITATVGVLYTYDVNATDPDGDTLTYSLDLKPSGMTINSATGLIIWVPTAKGNYAVVVKVSDGSLSITQSFKITVITLPLINLAPVINSIPGNTAIVGVKYTYTINATDPNGDAITYSLVSRPSGMTFNGIATISWTPTKGQVGVHGVTVRASDGKLSTPQSFTITVSAVGPEPEIELTGIVVAPKTMSLFVGKSEAIKSVTATYEIRRSTVPIALGECTYTSSPTGVVTVDAGLVTAVAEGTATITVSYLGKTDTLVATVKAVEPIKPVHNITKDIYYDTIQEAIDAANNGNTIYVANGTYEATTENSQQHFANDDWWFFVTIDKSFELIGESQDGVILDGTLLSQSGNVTRPTCIWISASNVTVENFTIRNFYNPSDYSVYSYGVVSWKDLKDEDSEATITDVTLDNLKVQDCLASIYFMRTEYPTVKNCIVEDGLADGIWIASGCDYATIQDNTVLNSRDHGIWVGGWDWCGPSCDNATITDNYIDGAREGGISFVASDGAIISGNTITNVAGDGWSVGALSLKDGPSNVEAYDNTIYGNDGDWSGYSGTGHGIGIDGESFNINLHYNNIYGNTGDGIHNYSIVTVDATNNWWGHATGPSGDVADPGTGIIAHGTGDAVSDNVYFDPFSENQY